MKAQNMSGHRHRQVLIAGMILGAFISWALYFYMHSEMQERQIMIIEKQKKVISELERKNEIWQQEIELLNDEAEKGIKIQEIQVSINNFRDYKLDLLAVLELQEDIRKDLNSLITKDLESVYKGKLLIKRTIENKTIDVNDKKYTFEVTEMMFYTTLFIEVKLVRK
ncbi:MAG: sporulation membrane protein YtrI [Bacillus sp. (in: firmicutes)]